MAGGFSGALSGLAGVYPAYQQAQMADYQLDDQRRQALARTAMGNALSILAGGPPGMTSAPGGPQPPMPGQASQPMQQPGGAPGAGPMPPPAAPQGAAGPAPRGLPAPGAPGPMPITPQGVPQGGGGPQLPQGNQPLDWRQLVAAVKQANPNLPPDVMAQAVSQFMPMMTAQSQMEWRQISLQLREQGLQQREQQVMLMEQGRNQRADIASQDRRYATDTRASEGAANRVSRETIAKMTIDERREAHDAGLISKEQMDEANRAERAREADQRTGVQREAEAGRERRSVRAEEGRTARAQLSADTRTAMTKLSIEARREIAQAQEEGRTGRANLSAETRKEISQLNANEKRDLTEYLETGRNERAAAAEEGRGARATAAEAGRTERAGVAEEGRELRFATQQDLRERQYGTRREQGEQRLTEQSLAREGRERLGQQRLQQQQSQFEQRESRLTQALQLRSDTTYQRLEQQKQAALQRAQASEGKQGLAELKAIIDQQDKHVRTRIQAYSMANTMTAKERKAMLDQADMDYNEQVGRLREQFGRSTPTGGTSPEPSASKVPDRVPPAGGANAAGQAPKPVDVPEAFRGDADGTTYQKDGGTWTKRGNQLVPAGG